ncbi:pancreatic progenitor cell differentiation and proliferation factor-like protein [Callorhinchus milii]|uniref:pancreatic progenitor cell differentiation and proliferation factor-like protein n=1 Tax=Callorhinchus milii TaxID=7868 RepID=UPI00045713A7|nr:pancreatic progenitor cell differentiation and proliferation factor-like protein [Callorhinchus milii]|eukprot:gi/632973975/ref/XP_007903415.1/ PREDICTED: pancreatic progenitor cell differentiation and proliferation factor-like protein [Callorhinchus milii]
MAAVPSPGCLSARNQFYRSRLNSASNTSSSSSDSDRKEGVSLATQESSHEGLPLAAEKNWWIACLFANPVVSKFSAGSTHR